MKRIIIFSGAGISAESGIQTFRDEDNGLWHNEDLNVVCNYDTWTKHFNKVHEFYNKRRLEVSDKQPNLAHHKIVEWASKYEVLNFTQNIDDLFEKAGSTDTVHLHGFVREMQCKQCKRVWDIGYAAYDYTPCECGCKRLVKPNVVFFNENAPEYLKMYKVLESLTSDDIIIVVGTSNNVINFNMFLMGKPGTKIFINPKPSNASIYGYEFNTTASLGMAIVDELLINGTL